VESLPSKKKDPKKKREKREQGLKRKEVKPHMKKLHVSKKERMKFTSCWERFYQKKERKEITFSYSAKSDVCPHSYPCIICICTTIYSLTFPFLTSIHDTILIQP
jgi:hypothetical protein